MIRVLLSQSDFLRQQFPAMPGTDYTYEMGEFNLRVDDRRGRAIRELTCLIDKPPIWAMQETAVSAQFEFLAEPGYALVCSGHDLGQLSFPLSVTGSEIRRNFLRPVRMAYELHVAFRAEPLDKPQPVSIFLQAGEAARTLLLEKRKSA